jgi:hypothetical protein
MQESKRQQDLADAAKAKQQESVKISDEIQGLQKEMKRQIELESNQETKDKQLLAQA